MKKQLLNSLNGMGLGLLATLVVGTILAQLGTALHLPWLTSIGNIAKVFMAGGIGIGVAHAFHAHPYVMFVSIVCASVGAGAITLTESGFILGIGEPAGAYVAALVCVLIGNAVTGKTMLDLLLVPATCLVSGCLSGLFISPFVSSVTKLIGSWINEATLLEPFLMGALIAVMMSLVILSPISSAALAASLGLSGLAAGAAVAGCSASMIGFAVASYRENKLGGLMTQGLGTSKVQFVNAVKNPYVMIPPTISACCVGILSTTVFEMQCNALGAGMGSSGLVGQLQTLVVMGSSGLVGVLLLHFILPAVISFVCTQCLRQKEIIKVGDLTLQAL